jgi:hypothetical protein
MRVEHGGEDSQSVRPPLYAYEIVAAGRSMVRQGQAQDGRDEGSG